MTKSYHDQPTQILARKAQLSASVVIPPVGLKLEEKFKVDIILSCYFAILP